MNFGIFIATLAIQEGLPIALAWGKKIYELKEPPSDAEWNELRAKVLKDIRELDPDDPVAAKLETELASKIQQTSKDDPQAPRLLADGRAVVTFKDGKVVVSETQADTSGDTFA